MIFYRFPEDMNQNELFSCGHCDIKLDSIDSLKEHLKTSHEKSNEPINLKETIFKCKSCDKTFHSKPNLVEHRLQCGFKCDMCEKVFKERDNL